MESKRLLVVLGTIFLVLVMGLVPIIGACAKPAPTPTPTPGPKPTPTPTPTIETLKIGCSLPLNKTYGVAAKEWYDVIIPAFNEAGGLVIKGQRYNIDLIIEDDKYTAEAGKAAAEKLVNVDKVKYIIGTIGAESTGAMLSVTEPNKVILITAGGSEKILGPDVKYGLHFAGGTGLEPSNWGYVKENYTGIKTYLLTVPDTEAGRNKVAREIPCAKILGAKEAGPTLFYSATETDFGPFATKVKSYQPDMLLFDTTPSPSVFGLQLKELYKSGWRGLKVQTSSFDIAQVVAVCGNEAIEGTVININVADIEPPMNQIISTRKAAYTKKYGKFSSEGIAWATCFDVFIAAMKKADSLEPDDILAALPGLTGETQQGHFMCVKRPDLKSGRVCDAMFDYYMGVVENGKLVFKTKLSPEGRLAACEAAWGYAGEWR